MIPAAHITGRVGTSQAADVQPTAQSQGLMCTPTQTACACDANDVPMLLLREGCVSVYRLACRLVSNLNIRLGSYRGQV
jgi:hypothetical protein